MVRAQGGTETAVRLGMWTRDFYAAQQDHLALDSGFVAQGYCMPCFTEAEVVQAHERIAMQRALGLDVRWVDPDEFDALNPAVARARTLGSSYAPGDGYIDPPRNVVAYTSALVTSGVEVHEGTAFTGFDTSGGRVSVVNTDAGSISTGRLVLTGGPQFAAVGRAAGMADPRPAACGTRSS